MKAKITVADAVKYISASMHGEARKEFSRRFEIDGKEILIVGASFEGFAISGFPNPPRRHRIHLFVDGRPRFSDEL